MVVEGERLKIGFGDFGHMNLPWVGRGNTRNRQRLP
jgi:hypothetical protein